MSNSYNCVNKTGCRYNPNIGCGLGGCRLAAERRMREDKKSELSRLLDRIDIFDDTDSLCEGLYAEYGDFYWILESMDHMKGQQRLLKAIRKELNNGKTDL